MSSNLTVENLSRAHADTLAPVLRPQKSSPSGSLAVDADRIDSTKAEAAVLDPHNVAGRFSALTRLRLQMRSASDKKVFYVATGVFMTCRLPAVIAHASKDSAANVPGLDRLGTVATYLAAGTMVLNFICSIQPKPEQSELSKRAAT